MILSKLSFVLLICFVSIIYNTHGAFTVIIDPTGFSTTSFPVSELIGLQYSYATPAYDSKWALIATDLSNTNFKFDTCYFGGGEADESRYYYDTDTQQAFVKVEVEQTQFFSFYCMFETPSTEQTAIESTFTVYELHDDDATSAKAYAEAIQGAESLPENVSLAVFPSKFELNDVYTEKQVFAHHYTFVPDEYRLLLNATEITLLKEIHAKASTSKALTEDDVLILDYWTEEQKENPQGNPIIHIILHVTGATSELDFQRNVKLVVQQALNRWEIPLVIDTLEGIQSLYLSHCFNERQDFDEPNVDCGSPSQTKCGRCYLPDSSCHQHEDCVSGDCSIVTERCELDYGHRNKKPDSASSLSLVAVALLLAFTLINLV